MTTIDAWKCDICGKVFMQGDSEFYLSSEAHIFVEGSGMYSPDERFDFSNICRPCRGKLVRAIDDAIQTE